MGLNAYFAYQVVGFHGSGNVSYGLALAAVFIEGFIFILLSLLGMRQWLVRLLPTSVKIASGCGIGLFLALVGLSYSSGIGAISGGATATPLDIAGCPQKYLNPVTGHCDSHKMTSPNVSVLLSDYILDILIFILALDWIHSRGSAHRISHGIQSQECNHSRDYNRVDHLLAVSSSTTSYPRS
jgi:xanthine/uracil/vitamin C permease (AzgA family)